LVFAPTFVLAQSPPATVAAFQPAQSTAGCGYVQFVGGAPGFWIALSVTNPGFDSQFSAIQEAFYHKQTVIFQTSGTVCNYPKLEWIIVGTQN
jgi:hypothetical protein